LVAPAELLKLGGTDIVNDDEHDRS